MHLTDESFADKGDAAVAASDLLTAARHGQAGERVADEPHLHTEQARARDLRRRPRGLSAVARSRARPGAGRDDRPRRARRHPDRLSRDRRPARGAGRADRRTDGGRGGDRDRRLDAPHRPRARTTAAASSRSRSTPAGTRRRADTSSVPGFGDRADLRLKDGARGARRRSTGRSTSRSSTRSRATIRATSRWSCRCCGRAAPSRSTTCSSRATVAERPAADPLVGGGCAHDAGVQCRSDS